MLPAMYFAYTQRPEALTVLAATEITPEALAAEVRRALDADGIAAPVLQLSSMSERLDASIAAPRFQFLLIGSFATVATLLAAVGLYGTLAFTVRTRLRELGIRLAMGASRGRIFALVLRQAATVLVIGLGLGVLGAFAATRLMQGFLYEVQALDPLSLGLALVVLVLAVLVAALRPALSAARLDPMATIRRA
jgi:ABC-type antimicrobial peptide transport system permease subunit